MLSRRQQDELLARSQDDPLFWAANTYVPTADGPKLLGSCWHLPQQERLRAMCPNLLAVANGQRPEIGRFWWEMCKGWSKTTDLALLWAWAAAFSRRIDYGQWFAADQDQAAEGRRSLTAVINLPQNGWWSNRIKVTNYKITGTATSFEGDICASDSHGSHGGKARLVTIDEIVHCPRWDVIANALDNSSKIPGIVAIATNCGWLNTDAFRLRELARTSPRWSYHATSGPPPHMDPAEVEEARLRNTPQRFARLFEGVWVSVSGDCLDPSDLQAAIDPSLAPITVHDRTTQQFTFIGGVDAAVKKDHAAFVTVAVDHQRQRIRLADVRTWAPRPGGTIDLEQLETAILESHRRFGLAAVHYDPHQMAHMSQRLQRAGVPMQEFPFVGKNLDTLASTLVDTFRGRKIDLFPCDRLIQDLNALVIVEKSFGLKLEPIRTADGSHGDSAIALALCLPAAVSRMGTPATIVADWPFWKRSDTTWGRAARVW